MKTKSARVVIDALLSIMLVLEMFIQFTGEFLHEVIGFAFFATIIVHLAMSARWIKGCARNARTRNLNRRAVILAVMGSLLGAMSIVLAVSSIAISNILASAGFTWTLGTYALWASIHTAAAYALCALVVVHLATHWVSLAASFKVPYDPSRRQAIGTGVNALAALGAVALGVTALSETLPFAAQAAQTSQASTATASASASAAAQPTTGRHEHGQRGTRSAGTTGTATSSTNSASAPSAPSSASSSSTSASGICTLCRKQCPLSAPQCNKPYEQGLL